MLTPYQRLALAILAPLCWTANAHAIAIAIDAQVTDLGGGLFNYQLSIDNDIDDLLLVTLTDAPFADDAIEASLTAPAGFTTSYDSGLGLLDLIAAGIGFFPLGVSEFFSFNSNAGPTSNFTAFEAFGQGDFPLASATGSVDVTPVDADVPIPPAPWLLLLGLPWLLGRGWPGHSTTISTVKGV
ncbi:MAG: hypothetical protein ACFCBW_07285 [Candidatus Competibacterales bacterium]